MRTVTLAAMLLLLGAGARAQGVGQTIDVHGWKVHLSANADGSHTCAAMWQFEDKSAVGFAADTDQHTFLIVSEPDAGLTKDQQYEAKFHVDGGKSKTVTGIATSAVMLVMPVSDPDDDFAALGAGKAVTVDFDGGSYEEPLQGSHDAIRALARCIAGAPAKP